MIEQSISELAAALERLRVAQPDAAGFTNEEWADHWGVTIYTARARIGKYIRAGAMRCVGRKPGTSMDGRLKLSPAYTVVLAEKPKGRKVR